MTVYRLHERGEFERSFGISLWPEAGGIMPRWIMQETLRKPLFYTMLGFTFGMFLTGGSPLAAQENCKLVMDAGVKVLDTPTHVYVTMNMDGKPQTGESIYAGGLIYLKSNGKWTAGTSNKEMKEISEKNRQNNQSTCHYIKDELVNGELAAEYSVHDASAKSASDSKIWISKSKGLPLRSDTLFPGDKNSVSIRYEYGNIKPPM
jgi:hypothetical protein